MILNHSGISKQRGQLAGGLAALLLLMTAGWLFANVDAAELAAPVEITFSNVVVTVLDEAGQPIEGATILPFAFRLKGPHNDGAYGWNRGLFGAPRPALTGKNGNAQVRYPVEALPSEKEYTGALLFNVTHPEFANLNVQGFSVSKPEQPLRLTRGIPLEVTGYVGAKHEPVLELIPNLSRENPRPENWEEKAGGAYSYHKLAPGGHVIQLMGRLPSGEIVHSEALDFVATKGKEYRYAMEMKPGIRLEGHLNKNVRRPVMHGRVLICVRPKQFPTWLIPEDFGDLLDKYGSPVWWRSHREIAEDGSFVFESLPPGEVDVVVEGDGFVSKSIGQIQNRVPVKSEPNKTILIKGPLFGIPQPFPLIAPTTTVEIVTEATATLEITAKTKSGAPIVGAKVQLSPNVLRMHGLFGVMDPSSEQPFRAVLPLSQPKYDALTDENGRALLRNLPPFARGLEIDHPDFEAPIGLPDNDRYIRFKLAPGETTKLELTLIPKGKQFIGAKK